MNKISVNLNFHVSTIGFKSESEAVSYYKKNLGELIEVLTCIDECEIICTVIKSKVPNNETGVKGDLKNG